MITTHAPIPQSNCVDKKADCDHYDLATACTGDYREWAIDNCQRTCNLCSATGNVGTTISGSSPDRNWMIMLKVRECFITFIVYEKRAFDVHVLCHSLHDIPPYFCGIVILYLYWHRF